MANDSYLELKNRYITMHTMKFCTTMDSAKLQKLPTTLLKFKKFRTGKDEHRKLYISNKTANING